MHDKLLIISLPSHNCFLDLFRDIRTFPNVYIRDCGLRVIDYRILSFLRKIHLCRWANTFKRLPAKYIWYNYYDIMNISHELKCVLIFANVLQVIDLEILKNLKKKGIFIYILFVDALNSKSSSIRGVMENLKHLDCDKVFTFDLKDAQRYNFEYLKNFCYYSKHRVSRMELLSDAFFICLNKGNREKLIREIYLKISKGGGRCNFNIKNGAQSSNKPLIQGINYLNTYLPYDVVLEQVIGCNCIVEIVQEKQTGPTLRYFEAICYNKKLLTNNPYIINFPFYNAGHMKIFKTVSDIDVEWIKERKIIDYAYKDEFSPKHLVHYLLSLN